MKPQSSKTNYHPALGDKEAEPGHLVENNILNVGDRVKVFFPMDNKYYEETATHINTRTGTHRITYDDGDQEVLKMENEQYYSTEQGNTCNKSSNKGTEREDGTPAYNFEITPTCKFSSKSDIADKHYLDLLGFKEFTLSEAQGL